MCGGREAVSLAVLTAVPSADSKSIRTAYPRLAGGANSLSLGLSGRRPKVSEKGISSHDRVVDREGNKKC